MNWIHLHLALNHIPVLGPPFLLLWLVWAWTRRETRALRFCLQLFVALAVVSIAIKFTGDFAAEAPGALGPGDQSRIQFHEETADQASTGVFLMGLTAFGTLLWSRRARPIPAWMLAVVAALAVLTLVLMGRTANSGGQIRHPQVRPGTNDGPAATRPSAGATATPLFIVVMLVLLVAGALGLVRPAAAQPAPSGLVYIDTGIENGSPLWHETDSNGVVQVHLVYDHERSSPNRAAGHIHFRLHAQPGTRLTLEFRNLDNIYNGRPGSVANELKSVVTSPDGVHWTPVALRSLPDNRVQLPLTLEGPTLTVARVEPYRLSDLDRWLDTLRSAPQVKVFTIGRTVEGRPLEMIRVGRSEAPHRVFLRARAHPWEAGGNWVVEGLVRRLLSDTPESRSYLERYCVYVLPMANKDGVAHGRTRFNLHGKDLNRDWDQPASAELAPENHALEQWLLQRIADHQAPHLALELHNDGSGLLHLSRPPAGRPDYVARMTTLESLLRKHTWFTEGSRPVPARNVGTLADGWLERFGIDAAVHEFNCQWIAGLQAQPTAQHWLDYGAGLARVLFEYFDDAGSSRELPNAPRTD